MVVPDPPERAKLIALCEEAYGLSGRLERLPGENLNFLLDENGRRCILKLAGDELPGEVVELEHRMIEHLSSAGLGLRLPRILPNRDGAIETQLRLDNGDLLRARLLEFVSGIAWCEAGEVGSGLLRDLGRVLGELDLSLAELDLPAAYRTHRWDLARAGVHREKIPLIGDTERRRLVEKFFNLYAASALPHLPRLPHSLIHGDANDENVIVEDGRVTGLLDFADSLYNPVVCELAVALAYAMLDQPEPLHAGAQIVAGYHAVHPLSLDELEVLYPLACGRLCTTAVIAAERRKQDPEHPTWYVTEERAYKLLERLDSVDPVRAAAALASMIDLTLDCAEESRIGELLGKRQKFIGPSLSIAYEEPLKMVRGEGQYLYDHRGRPFLDLVNNVCHVGHCHPRVVAAGQRQMERLNTNTRYLYDNLTEYAERLTAKLPDPLEVCFFVNSGSEANELALRLAETYTGRRDWLVIDGAYHGNTTRLIDLSPYKFMGPGGRGRPEPWVHVVPIPDGYRGTYRGISREIGEAYGEQVGRVIAESGAAIAGFLAEPLLGVGGQIIPPPGYLKRAFEHVRAAGGLCVADEVQVGFGRSGTHFWAFQQQDVVPDIVVMGKPIGNGHPLGAVVTTQEIAGAFANGMEFFSTFGGNPVSCAVGMAVLDVIESEGLQAHALELGNYFIDGLRELIARHALIGDVRGAGLFIGVELVRDRETLEPAAEEAAALVERMKDRGVLLSTDGPLHNVIKIKPPMVIQRADVDMVLRVFEDVLRDLTAGN
jgi:4-aminobutyrate aminotransferase-like enzyme/Ser/Thr protein kinase RdoA (MazF antagonist)